MSRKRLALVLPAALFFAAVLQVPAAQASFLKGGLLFNADDTQVDTSNSHWIVGFGSDSWLNEVLSLGFEVDFTYTSDAVAGTNAKVRTLYIYPYLTAKLRVPTRGFQLYTGGGIGYSPIITEFDGDASQVGGLGMQVLGGVEFNSSRGRSAGLFIEAQYKVTKVNDEESRFFAPDTGSYDLFTIVGGIHF